MGSEPPKEKMDVALEDMKQSLHLLEEKFLQDQAFLAGSRISVADVVAVVEIMQVKLDPQRLEAKPLRIRLHPPSVLLSASGERRGRLRGPAQAGGLEGASEGGARREAVPGGSRAAAGQQRPAGEAAQQQSGEVQSLVSKVFQLRNKKPLFPQNACAACK